MRQATDFLPSLAVLCAGAVWGAFWLPLRALEATGFSGAWAAPPPIAVSVLILLPVVLWRWRRLVAAGWGVALLGMASGTGYALYSDALLLTEIVTAILLFYLTPVWSTILARIVLGQPITGLRIGTIALGLAGLWVILGIDGGFPTPRGLGDWLGLVSGMIWAVATVCFRKRSDVDPVQMAFYYLSGALVMAVAIALVFMPTDAGTFGRLAAAALAAWPLIAFSGVVMFAGSMVLLIWATQRIDPGRVGVLLMIEVPVAMATAAWLTDEPFGWRQIVGGGLILAAAASELLVPATRPASDKASSGDVESRGIML